MPHGFHLDVVLEVEPSEGGNRQLLRRVLCHEDLCSVIEGEACPLRQGVTTEQVLLLSIGQHTALTTDLLSSGDLGNIAAEVLHLVDGEA